MKLIALNMPTGKGYYNINKPKNKATIRYETTGKESDISEKELQIPNFSKR